MRLRTISDAYMEGLINLEEKGFLKEQVLQGGGRQLEDMLDALSNKDRGAFRETLMGSAAGAAAGGVLCARGVRARHDSRQPSTERRASADSLAGRQSFDDMMGALHDLDRAAPASAVPGLPGGAHEPSADRDSLDADFLRDVLDPSELAQLLSLDKSDGADEAASALGTSIASSEVRVVENYFDDAADGLVDADPFHSVGSALSDEREALRGLSAEPTTSADITPSLRSVADCAPLPARQSSDASGSAASADLTFPAAPVAMDYLRRLAALSEAPAEAAGGTNAGAGAAKKEKSIAPAPQAPMPGAFPLAMAPPMMLPIVGPALAAPPFALGGPTPGGEDGLNRLLADLVVRGTISEQQKGALAALAAHAAPVVVAAVHDAAASAKDGNAAGLLALLAMQARGGGGAAAAAWRGAARERRAHRGGEAEGRAPQERREGQRRARGHARRQDAGGAARAAAPPARSPRGGAADAQGAGAGAPRGARSSAADGDARAGRGDGAGRRAAAARGATAEAEGARGGRGWERRRWRRWRRRKRRKGRKRRKRVGADMKKARSSCCCCCCCCCFCCCSRRFSAAPLGPRALRARPSRQGVPPRPRAARTQRPAGRRGGRGCR